MSQHPNILFITTDQQRFDHIGALGMRGIATPTLDRIAREGAHFTRAYCPAPVCTPTRLSLLTGLLPSVHRAHTLGISADPFPAPTIPARLGEVGYRSALVGKTHFVERRLEETQLLSEIGEYSGNENWPFDGPFLGFDHVQAASGHNINCVPEMHYRRYLERTGLDWRAWFPKARGENYDQEWAGAWEIPAEHHNTAWVARETARWLEKQPTRGEQNAAPWFCWASFEDPHEPMVCPEPYFSRVNTDEIVPFEGAREGEFDNKPPFYAQLAVQDYSQLDDIARIPCVFTRPRLQRDSATALQATLGMIGFLDEQIGHLIALLEARNELENTIIVFTSDHGEMHGHHGFWGKGATAFEDCQRVPLLIWAPGRNWRTGKCEALASLIDLPRLFLHLAGIPTPQGIQGADLLPYLSQNAPAPRIGVTVEAHLTARFYQLSYIENRFKIVIYRDQHWGELYDLECDPDQYENLWDRDLELRARMLQALSQQRVRDEGFAHPRASFG